MHHELTGGFVEPEYVADLQGCWFYHSMDLPGFGEVQGHWDLRPTIDVYLGNLDFRGKRVLDVGAASGFLSFAMEQRGAEVISLDIDVTAARHIVPYAGPRADGLSDAQAVEEIERSLLALHRGYWLAHRLFQSRARVYWSDVLALDPAQIGRIDVAVFGMVLPHLRDTFAALESVTRLEPRQILITQQMPQTDQAIGYFLPSRTRWVDAWWSLSAACLEQMLNVLGYDVRQIETHDHLCVARGETEPCTTLLAERELGLFA